MNFQEKVNEFCTKFNIDSAIEFKTLDLVSEVGEFSKEILKATDYGKEKITPSEDMVLEMGDVFYSLIAIANELDINLNDALDIVLKKYESRINNKGDPGSE
ncbi:MazG-like family protein [Candidatus Woesearchaeota archaeon]|nr:MazG-like family protein [Candidatus Woesearchaeota archaeon]